MKKAINILANLALAISVLLLAAVLVGPPLVGLTLEPILGASMEPAIMVGAMIAMEEIGESPQRAPVLFPHIIEEMEMLFSYSVPERGEVEMKLILEDRNGNWQRQQTRMLPFTPTLLSRWRLALITGLSLMSGLIH